MKEEPHKISINTLLKYITINKEHMITEKCLVKDKLDSKLVAIILNKIKNSNDYNNDLRIYSILCDYKTKPLFHPWACEILEECGKLKPGMEKPLSSIRVNTILNCITLNK